MRHHTGKSVRDERVTPEQEVTIMPTIEKQYSLDDWETEILPRIATDSDTIITLRTREVIVANQSKLYKTLTRVNKVLLVLGTLALLAVIGLSVAFSIVMLNNLHVLSVMNNQRP